MQRFDLYVLRTFLAHWLVIGAAFLGLFLVMEALGKSDEFARGTAAFELGALDVLRYFALDLPFKLLQFAPYITLLSGLGSVLTLLKNREWTPALTAGRPTSRAFLPMFAAALAIGAVLGVVRESLAPRLLPEREALMKPFFSQREWAPEDLWARGAGDARMKARVYLPATDTRRPTVEGLEVHRPSPTGGDQMVEAVRATWDGEAWVLEGGLVRGTDGSEEAIARFATTGLTPRDLERAYFGRTHPLDLSAADWRALLRADPDHRQAATLDWTWRIAPLVHLVLLALGLPFALSFERRSSLEGLSTGLLFCALYFVVELLLRDLGGRGVLEPWLAGTGPVLLFGSVGLWAFERIPT